MKIKVSNYIAQFLVENGIDTCFTLTGGGAMHLNDGLGHQPGLHCVYNHHEQACAIAAESYARINNKIAAVCVTTGPGGTNAITGVVGGWLDSIPMLILSGQVKYSTTAKYMRELTGYEVRAMGDQEFEICKAVECMTKYCEMVTEPTKIRYCLEKALKLANKVVPSCWLDIPYPFRVLMLIRMIYTAMTARVMKYCLKPDKSLYKDIVERIAMPKDRYLMPEQVFATQRLMRYFEK